MKFPKKLRHKKWSICIDKFATEYAQHDLLTQNAFSETKVKCNKVLFALAVKLQLPHHTGRTFETVFKRYYYEMMQSLVKEGVRRVDELPKQPEWLALVESKVNLLPKLLQELALYGQGGCSAECVVGALCAQASLRGTLCARDVYESVRRQLRLAGTIGDLHAAWVTAQRLSMQWLALSSRAGDLPGAAPAALHAHVADVVLLYTDVDTHQLITEESENVYAEAEALSVLWQLVQRHRLEERAPTSVRARRWSHALRDYLASNRRATIVVLQRRWHELKLRARRLLMVRRFAPKQYAPLPSPTNMHIAILTRYPHIATSVPTRWRELVESGRIFKAPLSDKELEDKIEEVKKPKIIENETAAPQNNDTNNTDTPIEVRVKRVKSECADVLVTNSYTSNMPCRIKVESDNDKENETKPEPDIETVLQTMDPSKIKTEILLDSDSDNELYIDEYRDENTTTRDVVKRESNMASRIMFDEDDDIVCDYYDDDDEQLYDKLVMLTKVKLHRVHDAPWWRKHARDDTYISIHHVDTGDDPHTDIPHKKVKVEVEVNDDNVNILKEPVGENIKVKHELNEIEVNDNVENVNIQRSVGEKMIEIEINVKMEVNDDTSKDDEKKVTSEETSVKPEEKVIFNKELPTPSELMRRAQPNGRVQRVSAAVRLLALPETQAPAPDNVLGRNKMCDNVLLDDRVQYIENSDIVDIIPDALQNEQMLTRVELQSLLTELCNVAMARQVLHTYAAQYCCALRRHNDIDDTRRRMGLAAIPPSRSPSACASCAAAACARAALHAELRALRRDVRALLGAAAGCGAGGDDYFNFNVSA